MFCVRAQYLLVRSSRVRGMVNMHRSRSEMARLAMKIFLVVNNTLNKINCIGIQVYQFVSCCCCIIIVKLHSNLQTQLNFSGLEKELTLFSHGRRRRRKEGRKEGRTTLT